MDSKVSNNLQLSSGTVQGQRDYSRTKHTPDLGRPRPYVGRTHYRRWPPVCITGASGSVVSRSKSSSSKSSDVSDLAIQEANRIDWSCDRLISNIAHQCRCYCILQSQMEDHWRSRNDISRELLPITST